MILLIRWIKFNLTTLPLHIQDWGGGGGAKALYLPSPCCQNSNCNNTLHVHYVYYIFGVSGTICKHIIK